MSWDFQKDPLHTTDIKLVFLQWWHVMLYDWKLFLHKIFLQVFLNLRRENCPICISKTPAFNLQGPIFSKAVLKCRWLLEHENLSKVRKYTGKFLNAISQISKSISRSTVALARHLEKKSI